MTLDLCARDLGFALAASLGPPGRARAAKQLEADTGALPCLSVRSAFDLWLRAQAFAAGGELVMSAVTLPDMARIAEHHGLVPVPVDVDPATMAPTAAGIAAAITPRTRAIVVAHLYGGRVRLGAIADVADRARVPLIEDCAQAFSGDPTPHPRAAVSLWSFGPIKTATALGGALVHVRDRGVLERMRAIADRDPVQRRSEFARRALKYTALAAASHPTVYGAAVSTAAALGHDAAAVAKRLSRGFAGSDLITAIRHRPSAPLLALLHRQLYGTATARVAARAAVGSWLARLLPAGLEVPGRAALRPTWWLFPVVVANPDELCSALRVAGFDASRGTTSLAAIAPPPGRPAPIVASALLASIVYLPMSATTTATELRALHQTLTRVARPRHAEPGRVRSRA